MSAKNPGEKHPGQTAWQIWQDRLDLDKISLYESLFALGNGYIGTRGTFEEGLAVNGSCEGTYLNGFYETSAITYGEIAYGYPEINQSMLNVTNGKVIQLYLEEEPLDMLTGEILFFRRVLDLRDGVLRRSLIWQSPRGKQARIETERLVSLVNPHLMSIAYAVTPLNFSGDVRIVSALDADVANTTAGADPRVGSSLVGRCLLVEDKFNLNGVCGYRQRAKSSGSIMACAMAHQVETGAACSTGGQENGDRLEVHFKASLARGQQLKIVKHVAYITTRECAADQVLPKALALVRRAAADGYAEIGRRQGEYLADFWRRSEVEIKGDPALLEGLRFNMFHLLQSVGRDGSTSIGAKGLTGEGYNGHYFWEAETYILPFFLHTQPEIARQLLTFRHHTLDKARRRARQMSHPRGALFPWRTIDGDECSAYYPAGTAQYHINADIALALRKYIEATDDSEFLADKGAEILFETARLWADLGTFSAKKGGRFCLNGVTGPDEYTAIVDNNFYTNLMARENLLYACQVADWLRRNRAREYDALAARLGLTEEEIGFWRRAAEGMYLPYDEELRIHPQDDTFLAKKAWDFARTPADRYPLLLHYHPLVIYRHQVCKQADVVLALFLQGDKFTIEEKRRDYDYYEPLTTHDSSLSPSIFSIVASEIGYRDKAYDYFLRSARMDLDDLYGNTDSGIHAANMAGSWMALVNGFGGMRTHGGMLQFRPYLPAGWREYSFRVTFRGRLIEVTVNAGEVQYELLEGDPLDIRHQDTVIRLGGEPTVLATRNVPPEAGEDR
ncbi:MAG: glycoside hydrolase family 65 protein [Bacteroidota bacterium]